jgi:hypothetical protein
VANLSAPPICENCRRVVHKTRKIALMIDGDIETVRELCSACKVHTADCFAQAAPWIDQRPVGRT